MKKRQRPQAQKNREMMRAMQELRKGSRTSPVPSGKSYKRPKAGARGRDW